MMNLYSPYVFTETVLSLRIFQYSQSQPRTAKVSRVLPAGDNLRG